MESYYLGFAVPTTLNLCTSTYTQVYLYLFFGLPIQDLRYQHCTNCIYVCLPFSLPPKKFKISTPLPYNSPPSPHAINTYIYTHTHTHTQQISLALACLEPTPLMMNTNINHSSHYTTRIHNKVVNFTIYISFKTLKLKTRPLNLQHH